MIDVLEELLRKIRPYETVKGSADEAFDKALDLVIDGLESQEFLVQEKDLRRLFLS